MFPENILDRWIDIQTKSYKVLTKEKKTSLGQFKFSFTPAAHPSTNNTSSEHTGGNYEQCAREKLV